MKANLDSLPEGVKEPKEPVDAVALNAATNQGGHFWLVKVKKLGSPRLRKPPPGDDLADTLNEFRFGKGQVGVGKAEVGKNVAAPRFHLHRPVRRAVPVPVSFVWTIPHSASEPP
jgi:hypothetical protein